MSLFSSKGYVLFYAAIASFLSVKFASTYLPDISARNLSIHLGDGECEWTPPNYEPDPEGYFDFFKTLIVGYPGVAKRIVWKQMEGLAGLATNDEWPDISYEDKANLPFMKANYPHHEGTWSWDTNMDQTVYVMRNPRHALREYFDIRWDIGFADSYEDALENVGSLYVGRATPEEFVTWRDERFMREIKWWGWHIDYWMEGGLLRDNMSNKYTTAEHFFYMLNPSAYGDDGSLFVKFVGEELVPPTYDDHCTFRMTEKCQPVALISVERLLDPVTGVNETIKIAKSIEGKNGYSVIAEEAWPCIWEKIIVDREGPITMRDRQGPTPQQEQEYTFTNEQLVQMITEIERLRVKYDQPEWRHRQIALDLVDILNEYHEDITHVIQGKKV